jgi:hypothetical protein
VTYTAGLWTPQERRRHITWKEARASAEGAKMALPFLQRGDHLHIQTDATSTHWCWDKGSKLEHMNDLIAPWKVALHQQGISYTASHLQGVDNTRADWLSRHQKSMDPKNYRLRPDIFRLAQRTFGYRAEVDLFASRLNHQLPRYGSWAPDPRSEGNAFHRPWTNLRGWVNPPWDIIPQVLEKIEKEKAEVLCCLPLWKASPWWRRLRRLLATEPLILRGQPLYQDPSGEPLGPPRWATLFCVLRAP